MLEFPKPVRQETLENGVYISTVYDPERDFGDGYYFETAAFSFYDGKSDKLGKKLKCIHSDVEAEAIEAHEKLIRELA